MIAFTSQNTSKLRIYTIGMVACYHHHQSVYFNMWYIMLFLTWWNVFIGKSCYFPMPQCITSAPIVLIDSCLAMWKIYLAVHVFISCIQRGSIMVIERWESLNYITAVCMVKTSCHSLMSVKIHEAHFFVWSPTESNSEAFGGYL